MIKNAKNLAKVEEMKKIFIKPDMTASERKEDWRLRQELKKRQESEEKQDGAKWIIRRNKVLNTARIPHAPRDDGKDSK